MCEACGERHATVHLTSMVDDETTTKNLCVNCFQADPSFTHLRAKPDLADFIRTGKCTYCGEPPVSGSKSSGVVGPDEVRLVCEQCTKDLQEFAAKPENQFDVPEIDPSLDNDKFLAELSRIADRSKQIEARRQAFMRRKVAQRRAGG
jgi:hypothetical protein